MLERKRILKVKEQLQRHGQRVFIYEHPKTGDVFTIADPNLRLDQVDEVQRDVAHLLEQGLNPPGGAQPAASSSTGSTETNQSDNARAEPLPKPREQPAVG